MNGYKAFYNGKSVDVYAETSYSAQLKAVELFKPPKSKKHMVHVALCELNTNGPEQPGQQVIHNPTM
jgi:hypothetical protein